MSESLQEDGVWFFYKCPTCGSDTIPKAVSSTDVEQILWCPKCQKEIARRPNPHVGNISYIASYNLIVIAKMAQLLPVK